MEISALLEELESLPEDLRKGFIKGFKILEKSLGEMVTKDELRSLQSIVYELAEAQKKTEERLTRLEKTVQELAEAQKRSEERLTRLEKTVQELAEAQKKTEERLTRLEITVQELAEGLKKLTESHYKLVEEHRKTREQLGGLSHSFGYVLEDRAMKSLPRILREDYGIEVEGKLRRDYIEVGKEYLEMNIYGKARKNGEEYILIGEVKSRLTKRGIKGFIRKCEKVGGRQIRLIISYIFSPPIREYLKDEGILMIPSYELEL